VNDLDAIISPRKGRRSPALGPVALLAGTETDLFRLCELMDFDSRTYQKLLTSRLYHDPAAVSAGRISITGPVVGAPYAVMVLETLIAWGAKKILFLGWCGSICEKVKIGDLVVATSAIIDEGTSGHYNEKEAKLSFPSAAMLTELNKALQQKQVNFHNGAIWTTDAIYRETCEKVKYFQCQDAIGVEMEISALFTVAQFRGVDLAAMAIVSDELASFKWRPGFKTDAFKHGRQAACTVVKELCHKI
jgi:uridine phosphorylase